MVEFQNDIIVGLHSIAEAINVEKREIIKIVATKDGFQELRKRLKIRMEKIEDKIEYVGAHEVQEMAKVEFDELGFEFSRVPSQVFLIASAIQPLDLTWLYQYLKSKKAIRLLALDQVTDVHNAAAILRTASFYGVDAILTSAKGSFGTGPNFNRIASGATEHMSIVKCSSLPSALQKLSDLGVDVIALSEHATDSNLSSDSEKATCLVLGAEDEGVSNAVSRVVKKTISLESQGQIKSLNVSVASAVAMEKIFGKK